MAVFDLKLGAYAQPFFVPSFGVAERGFADEVQNPESMISKHPEDFILFHIGEWAPEEGRITPAGPIEIARALPISVKLREVR